MSDTTGASESRDVAASESLLVQVGLRDIDSAAGSTASRRAASRVAPSKKADRRAGRMARASAR